jgi:DNA-binding NarL/FixJ family response regulator
MQWIPEQHARIMRPRSWGTDMQERFERHRQPWRQDEIQKLHQLAGKGMALKAIAKALTRSEESIKQRAKEDGLRIAKLR